jgi:hypothetical protein
MQLGVVVHICNPSAQETELEGSRVQGQPGLYQNTAFKKQED